MTPGDDLEMLIDASAWTATFGDVEALCRRAVGAALAAAPSDRHHGAISVLFTGDATMRRLNSSYRRQDKPTNVLSFPSGEEPWVPEIHQGVPRPLGDIAIGLEAVLREAEDEGKPPADHLCHLIVHGTLHLLGYDHDEDARARVMERLETQILAGLGVPDPYEPLMERDR